MRLMSLRFVQHPNPQQLSLKCPFLMQDGTSYELSRLWALARLILLTELTLSEMRYELSDYQKMQQDIAKQYATATHIDLDSIIPTEVFDPLLMDINHMLPEGAQYLATTLAEPLYNQLFSTQPPA